MSPAEVKKAKVTQKSDDTVSKKRKLAETDEAQSKKPKVEKSDNGAEQNVNAEKRKKKHQKKKKTPQTAATVTQQSGNKEVEEHKLFVKNLPGDVKETEIKALSSDILKIRLKKRGNKVKKTAGKLKKIFAYLVFETRELTEKNYELLKGKKIRDHELVVDYVANSTYTKKTPKSNKKKVDNQEKDLKRLHVSGFGKKAKAEEVKKLFPKCTDFFMPTKRDSDVNLRYAFVQFKSEKSAKKALEEAKEALVDGKKLVIEYACVKKEKVKKTDENNNKIENE